MSGSLLAIVPARKNSKRLPGKNKKLIGGKPLIDWTISQALKIDRITDILISTDDQDIICLYKNSPVLIPWSRPSSLATDSATSIDVVLHALEWYETNIKQVDAVMMLQPTSPFRSEFMINEAIDCYKKNPNSSIIGFAETHHHPGWTFYKYSSGMKPFLADINLTTPSQELEAAYIVSGSMYLASSKNIKNFQTYFIKSIIPVMCKSKMEAVDIDDIDDFNYAK